jgi:hypothetical protein
MYCSWVSIAVCYLLHRKATENESLARTARVAGSTRSTKSASMAMLDHPGQWGQQEQQERQERQGLQGPREREDHVGRRVCKEFKVYKAWTDRKGRQDDEWFLLSDTVNRGK